MGSLKFIFFNTTPFKYHIRFSVRHSGLSHTAILDADLDWHAGNVAYYDKGGDITNMVVELTRINHYSNIDPVLVHNQMYTIEIDEDYDFGNPDYKFKERFMAIYIVGRFDPNPNIRLNYSTWPEDPRYIMTRPRDGDTISDQIENNLVFTDSLKHAIDVPGYQYNGYLNNPVVALIVPMNINTTGFNYDNITCNMADTSVHVDQPNQFPDDPGEYMSMYEIRTNRKLLRDVPTDTGFETVDGNIIDYVKINN